MNNKQLLLFLLHNLNIIKRGEFTLRNGEKSSIYFDIKSLISYPNLMKFIVNHFIEVRDINYVCGVPTGAIPIATIISSTYNIPMLMVRKEKKEYGMCNQIDGIQSLSNKDQWRRGVRGEMQSPSGKVLLIEDVVTTGFSINEIAKILEDNGFTVIKQCIINRGNTDIPSILTMDDIMGYQIDDPIYSKVDAKKSNIIFSADYDNVAQIKAQIMLLYPYIIGVKLHHDIIIDYNKEFVEWINDAKKKYGLFFIDDRKYADISSTVVKQLRQTIAWADYITIHPMIGRDTIQCIRQEYPGLGMIGVMEMSNKGSLIDTSKIIGIIGEFDAVVCQYLSGVKHRYSMSPGVSLVSKGNADQQYDDGKDKGVFWIIGRGLMTDNMELIKEYREKGWQHLLSKIVDQTGSKVDKL